MSDLPKVTQWVYRGTNPALAFQCLPPPLRLCVCLGNIPSFLPVSEKRLPEPYFVESALSLYIHLSPPGYSYLRKIKQLPLGLVRVRPWAARVSGQSSCCVEPPQADGRLIGKQKAKRRPLKHDRDLAHPTGKGSQSAGGRGETGKVCTGLSPLRQDGHGVPLCWPPKGAGSGTQWNRL